MNLSRVDLNLFVVFEAIFTLGGITAAAGKLNLSQSAVSHALARLRTLYDDPLFERNSRGMAPTVLARTLIGDVRIALNSSCPHGSPPFANWGTRLRVPIFNACCYPVHGATSWRACNGLTVIFNGTA